MFTKSGRKLHIMVCYLICRSTVRVFDVLSSMEIAARTNQFCCRCYCYFESLNNAVGALCYNRTAAAACFIRSDILFPY